MNTKIDINRMEELANTLTSKEFKAVYSEYHLEEIDNTAELLGVKTSGHYDDSNKTESNKCATEEDILTKLNALT